MKNLSRTAALLALLALNVTMVACSPEVGSDAWCKSISEKPKGDLTATEAKDYAKHCIF